MWLRTLPLTHTYYSLYQCTTAMSNTFGHIFTLTTFGESHGEAIGGVVDGMPPGIDIDVSFIQAELNRRRPGQSQLTTGRSETDEVELLSGVFENKSTGTPIAFIVRNNNQRTEDYEAIRHLLRPSHADFTYLYKYGTRDYRGGGRASARTTISRCVGGALAKLALRQTGITIQAYTSQIGDIGLEGDYTQYDLSMTEQNDVRCPDAEKAKQMEEQKEAARRRAEEEERRRKAPEDGPVDIDEIKRKLNYDFETGEYKTPGSSDNGSSNKISISGRDIFTDR